MIQVMVTFRSKIFLKLKKYSLMTIISILSLTLNTLGTILIAYTALRVHDRVRKDHKIDDTVLKEMRSEKFIGVSRIVFIIISYVIQLITILN
jgi:hypothetical protein